MAELDREVHSLTLMNFFYLSQNDRDWLKAWLLKHAFLIVLILCFWLILNAWPKAESPVSLTEDSAVVQASAAPAISAERSSIHDHDAVITQVADGRQTRSLVEQPRHPLNAVDRDIVLASSALDLPNTGTLSGAVRPTGWRRTRNGWENAATWRTSLASLGDIVRQQQQREPDWFQNLLARVRSVPPWGVALLQIAAVVGVLLFERRASRQRLQRAIGNES